MTMLYMAPQGRTRRLGLLAVLLCLLAAGVGHARRQQSATGAMFSVGCGLSVLQAPWTGTDTVGCEVSADLPEGDVGLTCADAPSGLACAVSPPVVRLSPGTPAPVVVTVSYTEMLAPGRASFRLIAKQGDSEATHALAVVKDINTVSARCPSADDIRRIDRDLDLEFDHDPTKNLVEHPERCTKSAGSRDLSVMQARVYRSLATLRRLTFQQRLPWTRDSAYQWLTRAVEGVRFRNDIANSSCCSPDGMINVKTPTQSVGGPGVSGVALGITAPGGRMPTDFRMLASFLQLLVHEARHRDGKPHTCGTRDQTLAEMGGYGAAWAFLRWTAEQSPPGLVPSDAASELLRQAENLCRGSICKGSCSL